LDGPRSRLNGSGYIPWAVFGENASEQDTLRLSFDIKGDILQSVQKNLDSPIGGTGEGWVKFDFYTVQGNWHFTKGEIVIPSGILTLRPFALDDINNFSLKISVDSNAAVTTDLRGLVRKRPIRIFSTHSIPDGYEPLTLGPVDLGILQVETPKRGIHIHLPGFMVPGEVGDIEFAGNDPFSHFALSGPLDRLKITGTWIFRDIDFTFPFLSNNEIPWDFDPFPYITWEMDLKPGNRKMMYFWDLAGKKRRIFRFLEGYIDPSSYLMVRGRDLDKTFRLTGMIHSSKGSVFYGKVFDRNFDVAVEFSPLKFADGRGYDNMPIISGSAETMSDSSRLNRIKLTCMVNDPVSGAIAERGRLVEGKSLNVTFHLSSDFEILNGETEREFFQQAGLVFTTFQKAGEAVSSFGEQYFQRYLLQRWERRLARSVGLDVINIESSIASNYFNKLYSRQFNGLVNQNDYLAFANVGITVGRYFFRDLLFLKARGELIPIDTTLTPEYSIGLEFQANRYFTIDLNYGIHKGALELEHNPQVVMQLRLPLTRLRKFLNF
ncbi:MAG: hypothetical protein GX640_13765, partial [Fibrobacter sp.]|nr:hypothetical protein [Fibrobacter sp.]